MTFEAFYRFYLNEHSDARCRLLHFIGLNVAIPVGLAGLYTDWRLVGLAFLVGYGFAILGHVLFEGNSPASLRRPLWLYIPFSFMSDWKMWWEIWQGKISISYRPAG